MGKRVTLTTTRQDPSIPWFSETTQSASTEQALSAEQSFLMNNFDTISFTQTSTDSTLTLTFEFSDNAVFDEYVALLSENLASPFNDYCAANNMTVTKEITDI